MKMNNSGHCIGEQLTWSDSDSDTSTGSYIEYGPRSEVDETDQSEDENEEHRWEDNPCHYIHERLTWIGSHPEGFDVDESDPIDASEMDQSNLQNGGNAESR